MIDRRNVYLTLYTCLDTLYREQLANGSDDINLRDFIFGMELAETGVSLDQAVLAAFDSMFPQSIDDSRSCFSLVAEFLQIEVVDFWNVEAAQPFVIAFKQAATAGNTAVLPPVFQTAFDKLLD